MKKSGVIVFIGMLLLCCSVILCSVIYFRGHTQVQPSVVEYQPSARELTNPNRGFYYIHGFYIDEDEMDFRQEIAKRFCKDDATTLTMIQINLANFREGEISERGLQNIETLFEQLKVIDKKLVVRFLYDWDGECEGKEPDDINIILRHMEQVGPIVESHKNQIFTLQGLFIGNWGEMNGTPYVSREEIKELTETLFHATEGSVYLAVRMPMFWRRAVDELGMVSEHDYYLENRLGLYNDGMLGNAGDYGTYSSTEGKKGEFNAWGREEELDFQDTLCAYVPQGGEVINENEYNDLENAIRDFRKMHVTYLNRDYDQKVYEKWASDIVHTEDCFDGMDGFSYIERHMGYRLSMNTPHMEYDIMKDELKCRVSLSNSGFAPIYEKTECRLMLFGAESKEIHSYPLDIALGFLKGGNKTESVVSGTGVIRMTGFTAGTYELYLQIEDVDTGRWIELANEQDLTERGYLLGTIEVQ